MKQIKIERDHSFITNLENQINNEEAYTSWKLFQLAYKAEAHSIIHDFHGLKSISYLPHMDFLDHQIKTAQTVLEQMNGRAILADEVGLGKTIEAGLIIKEYMIRGLVKNMLLLVPASLVNQWVRELNDKFHIPAIAYKKNYSWNQYNIFVTSLDTAKREKHQEEILKLQYDLLLVDEAHKLKNHKTKNYEFVTSIKKKYCLLLTATPIQNRLIEIFNLVSILKPGLLGDYESFTKKFGKDRNNIKKDALLKQFVQKIMIRNTRKKTNLDNVKRKIETIWVDFTREERSVYEKLRALFNQFNPFTKFTYLREICSSREACYLSLTKLYEKEGHESMRAIINDIEQLPQHAKAKKLVELLQQLGDEKVIVFTEYRASQYYLQWFLNEYGITSVPFRGGFNKGKKDWMQQLFKNHAQVLIATEAGGEGINLQFCNHLINYDLPWNPMRLEQRIGRIHRYGQESDVHIYNFAILKTVEEHMMKLLYEKINLFEQVVGNLDQILAKLQITDFEKELKTIYSESTSEGEIAIKLENLTSVIHQTYSELQSEDPNYGAF